MSDLPPGWVSVTVDDAGDVMLGRQRHPDWHTGSYMRPYLRVANVFEDRIDTNDVMQMDFPPEVFERYALEPGDILLNEGQSPQFLGRPAMYVGVPAGAAFTNSLIRFRAIDAVRPRWAMLVFRHHMHSGRFAREVRITTNIAHLSATRFKSVEFPVPPLPEQDRICAKTEELLSKLDVVERSLAQVAGLDGFAPSRLRKAVLRSAVAGELVDQDPSDEPANVLLDRCRTVREVTGVSSTGPKKRARRATS